MARGASLVVPAIAWLVSLGAVAHARAVSNIAPAGHTSCGAVRRDCIRACHDLPAHTRVEKERTTECVKSCAEQYEVCAARH